MPSSVFLQFVLPNAPTWFYLSLLLAVALFLQFGRPHAMRNWDLLALFLFVPGFLILQDADAAPGSAAGDPDRAFWSRLVGYAWLLGAALVWFVRCLLDLVIVRRPVPVPNLTLPALAWFAGALFACLAAVTLNRPASPWDAVGRPPVALAGVQEGAAAVVVRAVPPGEQPPPKTVRAWVGRAFALVCHVAVLVALIFVGGWHFRDWPTGVAAATLYLLLPYTAYLFGQVHHVWPVAWVLWAVFWYRRPTVAGVLLGVAAGTAFFPALLAPVWLQFYRGRGVKRFALGAGLGAIAGLAVTLLVLTLFGGLPDGLERTLNLADWQPWRRPTSESVWTGVHWAYRLPVFLLYVGFVLTAWVWPPVRNLGHLVAASAAVLIGIQFWFADRGGLYVLWYAPLLVLVVLRPTLADAQPAPPGPLPGFVTRAGRWVAARVRTPPAAPTPELAAR